MNSRSEGTGTNSEALPWHESIDGPNPVNKLYLTPNSHFWQGTAQQIALWLRQISISAPDLTVILPQALHQGLFRSAWLAMAPRAAVLPQLLTWPQILALQRLQQTQVDEGAAPAGAENQQLQALGLALRWQAEGHLPKAYQSSTQFASRLALARDVLQLREQYAPLAQLARALADVAVERRGDASPADAELARHAVPPHIGAEESGSPNDGGWVLRMAMQDLATAAWWDDAALLRSWCAAQRGALVLVLSEELEPRMRCLMQIARTHGLPTLCVQAGFGRGLGLALARSSACAPTPDAPDKRLDDGPNDGLDEGPPPNDNSARPGSAPTPAQARHGAAPRPLLPRMGRLLAQRLQWWPGSKLEDQAQAIVSLIVQRRDAQPQARVALIALDRRLARRVNALLTRLGLPVRDEAGWLLSTTRAAASLQAVFEALGVQPSSDAMLDLLKQAGVADAAGLDAVVLETIETDVRAAQLADVRAWRSWAVRQEGPTARRHQHALDSMAEALRSLRAPGPFTVASWADRLLNGLHQLGLAQAWSADAAGLQIINLLQTQAQDHRTARAVQLEQKDYVSWLRLVLEAAAFRPVPDAVDDSAERSPAVHVLALRDALLRPWDLCILGGADASNLPAMPDAPGGLGDQACSLLGLPTREQRRNQTVQTAVKLVLGCNQLVVFEAPTRPDHPGPSPLLELWRWAMGGLEKRPHAAAFPARQVFPSGRWPSWVLESQHTCVKVPRPQAAPTAPLDIPIRWSPSAYADLRACPYRFFARRVLHLVEDEDLLPDFTKRDFGNTLHHILEQFHQQQTGRDPASNQELIDRIASEAWSHAGALAEPFAAAWPAVRDNYLDWLQGWRAQGWETQGEEQSLRRVIDSDTTAARADTSAQPSVDAEALRLEGRIDRIDQRGAERFALDYKTGDPQALKARMKRTAEDTQLLCYALLLGADADDAGTGTEPRGPTARARIAAGYLVVSERRDPEHTDPATELAWKPEDLREQSTLLLAQMRHDWHALRAGQAMPALGEPPICDHCEARGLCRRDHRPSPQRAAVLAAPIGRGEQA
jgi:ATP-dependent helicase/nuclease subunit B